MNINYKNNFLQSLLSLVVGLILFIFFYLPLELLLTEFLFIIPKINPWINTIVLLLFILIANLFNFKKIVNNSKKLIASLILIIVVFNFYNIYYRVKLNREYLPKIYKINYDWIIQGQTIKITGVNFGPNFKKGEIIVNGMEFLVKDWEENSILAEAPVPSKKGYFYIYVKTKDGKISNQIPLEIKDPDYLKEYLK